MSTSSFHDNLNHHLDQWSTEAGFRKWGFTSLLTPVSLDFYRTWIEQNYQGEMDYLRKHLPIKENPKLLDSRLESAFVFAHPYVPHPRPLSAEASGFDADKSSTAQSELRTAFYAQGEDYHFWLKEKLESIAVKLREQFPEEVFLCLTDSSPILERDLAYRAGLGWVGKNTCLIDPVGGSFLLFWEIVD
jgi:epoxyqueuosine reductase